MLSVAILDDEQRFISEYERRLPEWFVKHNIKGEIITATTSPNEFLKTINESLVNLCIIDINLRCDTNGMHVAKQIRRLKKPCEIIFMTGLLEYMQQAFDVQAFNFVQKPGWNALEKNVVKLAKDIDCKVTAKRKSIDLKCGSMVFFIPHDDITYIEHIGTKTTVFTKDGEYSTYEGLEELVSRICDPRIKQCHRSTYVNIDYVTCLDTKNKKLILKNESSCEIGPKFYINFKTQKDWSEFLCL